MIKPNKLQNIKNFLILSFGFALFAFHFALNCYAFNLDSLKTAFLKGDYKQAISEGEKILSGVSGNASELDELYYILGLSYLKDANLLRASDIFEIILREFKDSKFRQDAQLGLGDAYFLKEDYDNARIQYNEILKSNDHARLNPLVLYRLSLCALRKGDREEADKYLSKLKDDFPLNLETKINQDLSCPVSYYTVQVGSFSNSVNAKNLTEKLIQKGYPAYMQEAHSQGKPAYRVRAGKLKLRQEAQDLENKLSLDGYPTKICP